MTKMKMKGLLWWCCSSALTACVLLEESTIWVKGGWNDCLSATSVDSSHPSKFFLCTVNTTPRVRAGPVPKKRNSPRLLMNPFDSVNKSPCCSLSCSALPALLCNGAPGNQSLCWSGRQTKGPFPASEVFWNPTSAAANYIPCLCERRVLLTLSWILDDVIVSSASALMKIQLLALFAQKKCDWHEATAWIGVPSSLWQEVPMHLLEKMSQLGVFTPEWCSPGAVGQKSKPELRWWTSDRFFWLTVRLH